MVNRMLLQVQKKSVENRGNRVCIPAGLDKMEYTTLRQLLQFSGAMCIIESR
jgi:hypothetical protein